MGNANINMVSHGIDSNEREQREEEDQGTECQRLKVMEFEAGEVAKIVKYCREEVP